jgi:hypothetical protein
MTKKGVPKFKSPMPRGSRLTTPIEAPKLTKPPRWSPDIPERATRMCLLGLTNEEMAIAFECDIITWEGWLRERPELSRAIRAGREGADETVARALYLKACGYEHPEDDIRTVNLGGNAGSEIVITPTVRRYAPDTHAAQMWLHNRQRGRWKFGTEGNVAGLDPTAVAALMRDMASAADEDAVEDAAPSSEGDGA